MVGTINFHALYLLASHELVPREFLYPTEVGIMLGLSFLCITLARIARPSIYFSIFSGMIKTTGVRAHVRESLPLFKRGSMLLILNYLMSSALVIYFFLGEYDVLLDNQVFISTILPFALLVWNILSLLITGWITGEDKSLREPIIMKVLGAQTLGLVYSVYALVWVLNPDYHDALLQLIVWTFIAEGIWRVMKSVKAVYGYGISWYYIILYFCTLEILPLFVLLYFGVF